MDNKDLGRFGVADRAVVPSASSPQAVSPVPASIPSASHTPGPWREVSAGNWEVSRSPCAAFVSIGIRNKHPIAFAVWEGHYADAEFDANARLIAAAPELFDALQSALRDGGEYGWEDKARAALNKALGQ